MHSTRNRSDAKAGEPRGRRIGVAIPPPPPAEGVRRNTPRGGKLKKRRGAQVGGGCELNQQVGPTHQLSQHVSTTPPTQPTGRRNTATQHNAPAQPAGQRNPPTRPACLRKTRTQPRNRRNSAASKSAKCAIAAIKEGGDSIGKSSCSNTSRPSYRRRDLQIVFWVLAIPYTHLQCSASHVSVLPRDWVMGKGARRVPECYVRGHCPPYPYGVAVDAVYNIERLQ